MYVRIIFSFIFFFVNLPIFTPLAANFNNENETNCKTGAILSPFKPLIDNRVNSANNWIGYLKGNFEDCTTIKLIWKIEEDVAVNVKNYRLYRKGWDEVDYILIQTLSPDSRSFIDNVGDNLIKPVWHYRIYADVFSPDGIIRSNEITIWQIKDFYTKESLTVKPDTDVWIVNPPGNSLSTESRLAIVDTAQWPNLSKKIGGIVLYRSSIQSGTISELRNLVNVMNRLKIPLGVETGGFQLIEATLLDDKTQLGEKSFESEMRAYRNLLTPISQGGAGGKLDYIFFDGPIHSAVYPNDKDLGLITVEEAAWELTDLIILWR